MWVKKWLSTPVADEVLLWLAGLALLMVMLLSSAAFLLPQSALLYLAIINSVLLLHGLLKRGNIISICRYIVLQLGFTLLLYLIIHGGQQMSQGVWAVVRLLLALLPGWWLTVAVKPHWIGEVLAKVMPVKWAFVVAASINLLPYMVSEIAEIYQLQLMRGAKIGKKQLLNPRNWFELVYCVGLPMLVQLLKLAQQMELAARSRHFGTHAQTTHWRDPRSLYGSSEEK